MKTIESNMQIACVEWFRFQYPVYADMFFAIPNGGKRINDGLEHPCVRAETAVLAVHYAETEAEERHAQELQELRDKAVQAFCNHCLHKSVCADKKCATQQSFIYELNK